MSGPVPGDLDLLRAWFPVIRRLRRLARDSGTYAVLSIRVIVDGNGIPKHWTVPERLGIEPRDDGDDLGKLLEILGGKAEKHG